MVTIAEGIAAATFAMNAAKDLIGIDRSISEADFKLKIAVMTESIANVKIAMVELQDELHRSEKEVQRLRAAFKTKEETVKENGFHYVSDNGVPVGMPLCPVCIEEGSFQRIAQASSTFFCPKCTSKFGLIRGKANPNCL